MSNTKLQGRFKDQRTKIVGRRVGLLILSMAVVQTPILPPSWMGVNDNKMAKAKVEEPVGFAVVDCVWMSVAANGDSEIAAPWTGAPVGRRRGRLSIGS